MSQAQHRTSPNHEETGWPSGIKYIIGNEGCERFSFYGMRAILYIYIVGLYVNYAGMDEESAKIAGKQTYHYFGSAVYALPLIGAIIADRLLGKYRTIIWLSIVYCLGHAALAIFENPAWQEQLFGSVLVEPITGLIIGLGLIAVGSGGIKPCVSAHVGDQFGSGNWHLLQKVFNAFYFIINFGSAFATVLIPVIRGTEVVDPVTGFHSYTGSVTWAFAIPGILMGLATIFFWMGRKDFVHVPPTQPPKLGLLDVLAKSSLFMVIGYPIFLHGADSSIWLTLFISAACFAAFIVLFLMRQNIKEDDGFLAVLFYSAKNWIQGNSTAATDDSLAEDDIRRNRFFAPAAKKFGSEAAEGPLAVLKIMSIFIFVSVFWALFDQHGSTWIEQAKAMERSFDFDPAGWWVFGLSLGFTLALAGALMFQKMEHRVTAGLVGVVSGAAFALYAVQTDFQFTVQPSQVGAVNPFMVMILIPVTVFGLYPLLDRLGFKPTPLRRMTMGMFMAAFSFVAVALIQQAMDDRSPTDDKIHVLWQMVPYLILTLSEVMVSITGLEFAYRQAPKTMKSVIMGFWLFTVTLGNLLVVLLAGFEGMTPVKFFWTFAGLMAVAGALFAIGAHFYKSKDYTQ